MSYSPYKIIYRDVATDETGEAMFHAESSSQAEYLFHLNFGMRRIVVSCELDVAESEYEIAAFVAYRHHRAADPKKAVAKILKGCRIDRRKVRHRIARLGLPI